MRIQVPLRCEAVTDLQAGRALEITGRLYVRSGPDAALPVAIADMFISGHSPFGS
jgi:hypothetical protein